MGVKPTPAKLALIGIAVSAFHKAVIDLLVCALSRMKLPLYGMAHW
ncbi:hypothetical protein OH492_10090 [Vibrio chagasii]|nr:hypothetical protein [Vibrio chagasii]